MATIVYTPRASEAEARASKIIAINACAYQALPLIMSGSTPSVEKNNHWALFCAFSETESYRIDASPNGPNKLLVLSIIKHEKATAEDSAKICRVGTKTLTLGDMIDLILREKYDRYQFTPLGTGCRYWIECTIKLLNDQGYVADENEATALCKALSIVWGEDGTALSAVEQTPLSKGDFYWL